MPSFSDEERPGRRVTYTDSDSDNNNSNNNYNNNESSELLVNRPTTTFVSKHRKALDYIYTDSKENRHHTVPASARSKKARASSYATMDIFWSNWWRSRNWLSTLLPAWTWLRVYDWKRTFVQDLIAGLTVGIMIVPQSMSYAKLAGLPVEYGLYSALIPVYAYAFFGSSRQLAVGPVALISLLLSTGLTHIIETTPEYAALPVPEKQELYRSLAIQTSFLVGITYILMGLARLGFVTIFLSHAVISGFTTGAAVIIGMSQVKYLFGYDIAKSDRLHEVLRMIFENIEQFNYKTFLMGTASTLVLVGLKHLGKTYPQMKWARAAGPLLVVIIGILLVLAFDLENKGIPIVKHIPKGLPALTVSQWSPINHFGKLAVVVISIVIVGFMESIAIAKQLASKHKYDIDSSTELIGLGMANFLGGAFNAYPVTGSFSRSAVNNESGAMSGVSGMVTATLVMIVLLLLTPVFELLPLNVLASIVISGVLGLLDYTEAMYLYKVHKFDFVVWCTACVCTLFAGVEIGLAIAVSVSLLIVIYESAYPQTSVMGRLPGTNVYRNVKQYPDAEVYDGIVIIRIDAPLYFANAQNVREKIRKYRVAAEEEMAERNGEVKYLILEMSPVSHIDTSALHQLEFMVENYRSRGQQMCFANPSMLVMERLDASGLSEKIGRDYFFACLHDAVPFCLNEMDTEAMSLHSQGTSKEDEDSFDEEEGRGGVITESILTTSEEGDAEA